MDSPPSSPSHTPQVPTDQDTCRICRGEGSPEEPLFHPCKCSGSIKFVHQDCLLEWLRHSKKRPTCELCKTPFRFTKLYAADMPAHVPVYMFMKKLLSDSYEWLLVAVRMNLLVFLWLILLPFVSSSAIHVYTLFAESVPHRTDILSQPFAHIQEAFKETRNSSIVALPAIVETKVTNLWARNFMLDVFEGQVIILLLLLLFFIVMIVREWVVQNDLFADNLRDFLEEEEQGADRLRINNDEANRVLHQLMDMPQRVEDLRARRQMLALWMENNPNPEARADLQRMIRTLDLLIEQQPHRNRHHRHHQHRAIHRDEDFEFDSEEEEDEEELEDVDDYDRTDEEDNVFRADPPRQFPDAHRNQIFDQPLRMPPQFQEPPPMDQFDDLDGEEMDLLDLFGARGPLVGIFATHCLAMLAAVLITGAIFFVPYLAGRVAGYFMLNLGIIGFKHGLNASMFLGNEMFYYIMRLSSHALSFVQSPESTQRIRESLEAEALLRRTHFIERLPVVGATALTSPMEHLPGRSVTERFTYTLIGYAIVFVLAGYYMYSRKRFAKSTTGRSIERTVINYLKQIEAILKVITIIGIELVVFPICCGVLLDFAIICIFPNTTLSARYVFTINRPITGVFIHWMLGTFYMFSFALFVSLCRKIMRPGVLYFVRDPNDPNFHPIRDVLERPLLSQLRKIGISAAIYSVLIVVGIGLPLWAMRKMEVSFLPIYLFPKSIDSAYRHALLYLYNILILPAALKITSSLNLLNKFWDAFFTSVCGSLRLSSFILNRPVTAEQGRWVYPTFASRFNTTAETLAATEEDGRARNVAYLERDGYFVRAPNTDNFTTKKKLKLFIAVTKDDERIETIANDKSSNLEELKEYSVVYRPPGFRWRIVLLLLAMWVAGGLVVFTASALPLMVGRFLVKTFISIPEGSFSDIFTFPIGAVPVLAFLFALDNEEKIRTLVSDQFAAINQGTMANTVIHVAKVISKVTFSIAVSMVLLPSILGTLVEHYFTIPFSAYFSPSEEYKYSFASNLMLGLGLMVLFKEYITLRFPQSRIVQRYRDMIGDNWYDYDVGIALRSFLVPAVGISAAAFLIPKSLGLFTTVLYRNSDAATKELMFKFAYPAVLVTAIVFAAISGLATIFREWETTVRDQAYLVGEQLENM
ncbi:hypothetical protein TRVA0_006S03334 [Trichomonascus vanleenenianus]|uniref:E3 ubiquitin-protein ligase SSM4 n=1 Tax=Trichomonascus vanleenenianus TaxID=2268995 RepID=UPI003EC9D5E1